MTKHQTILQNIFWVIVLADITGNALNIPILHYAAKPLLMPALIILAFTAIQATRGKNIILTALFFSWMGDLFLMFENTNPPFFIFGLASFLATHILYIIYFAGFKNNRVSLLKKQPLLIVAVLLYGASLVWLLFPKLGNLKIPVLVYATVICTMQLYSTHAFNKVNKKAARLFLSGALLFVLSDSVLAINKFHLPFAAAGAIIMLTYCAAQYNIVCGFIKQNMHDKS
jgi:uncharacterized membrane protein YhhN